MDFRAIAMGLCFAFLWSSAFTSARIIVADAPPFAISAIRFALAGLIGVAIARWLFFAEAEHVVGLYYGKR